MIQFSFYVFLIHLFCIVYLVNSGEEFSRNFAKHAGLTYALLKIQFYIMSMCYVGLAYSCIAHYDAYELIIHTLKARLSSVSYFLSISLYVIIHLLWCTHFLDLSVRAHIYKHSSTGQYKNWLTQIFHKISQKNILNNKKQKQL